MRDYLLSVKEIAIQLGSFVGEGKDASRKSRVLL